jgi:hypothetical protein
MLDVNGLNLSKEKQIFKTLKWSKALLPPTSRNLINLLESNYFFLIIVIKEVPVGNVINLCTAASIFRKPVNKLLTK